MKNIRFDTMCSRENVGTIQISKNSVVRKITVNSYNGTLCSY